MNGIDVSGGEGEVGYSWAGSVAVDTIGVAGAAWLAIAWAMRTAGVRRAATSRVGVVIQALVAAAGFASIRVASRVGVVIHPRRRYTRPPVQCRMVRNSATPAASISGSTIGGSPAPAGLPGDEPAGANSPAAVENSPPPWSGHTSELI